MEDDLRDSALQYYRFPRPGKLAIKPMANSIPEIMPEDAKAVRPDAVIAEITLLATEQIRCFGITPRACADASCPIRCSTARPIY